MPSERTVEDTRALWMKLFGGSFQSLTALKSSVINGSSICDDSLRSVCWKLFMLLPDLQPDTWANILQTERQKYNELKKKYLAIHLKRAQENAGIPSEEEQEDLNVVNPLSQDISNPWNTFWKDEDLRKDILRDIERTFPDIDYFRDEKVQHTMLDILFVYTKMNPVVSYQQGMHEILAPIFWVISHDALRAPGEIPKDDQLMYDTLSADYVEHDSFALFNFIMQHAWEWYAAEGKVKGPSENGRVTPPIVVKARKIQEYYLRNIDPELERHLRQLGVEPQLWGIRWIRLLFGREFEFSRLLNLWDCLFAADAQSLDLVNLVCIAMLIRIRDQLLLADYTGALTLLLRYPVTDAMAPCTFIEDAIFLQVHVTSSGGRRIIEQYAAFDDELDNQQPLHMVNGMLVQSTKGLYQRRAMMEKAMSGIAKNVFDTSERLGVGVNKYVRDRVQDVRVRAVTALQNGTGGVQYLTPETSGIGVMPRPGPPQHGGGSRSKPTPQGGRARNGIATSSAFDEAAYNRERNDKLAEVLATSLNTLNSLLADVEDQSLVTQALDRIEYVKRCLLFDDLRVDKKYMTPMVGTSPKTSISEESIPTLSLPVPKPASKSAHGDPLDSMWVYSVDSAKASPSSDMAKTSSSVGSSKIASSLDTKASILFDSPPISSSFESSQAGGSSYDRDSLFESKPKAKAQTSSILSSTISRSSSNLFGSQAGSTTAKPISVSPSASSSTSPALAPISIEEAKMLLGI
ncbi:rab-GTPase-TBC domain-containing protein [Lipomyces orientalis]|uniref:Rab-GTPase-TBC domain-containing protein n=1 Tax=Lipomyces orientalis TaxID=1233043 RepID=A0ACC3TKD4_9ASCO